MSARAEIDQILGRIALRHPHVVVGPGGRVTDTRTGIRLDFDLDHAPSLGRLRDILLALAWQGSLLPSPPRMPIHPRT